MKFRCKGNPFHFSSFGPQVFRLVSQFGQLSLPASPAPSRSGFSRNREAEEVLDQSRFFASAKKRVGKTISGYKMLV